MPNETWEATLNQVFTVLAGQAGIVPLSSFIVVAYNNVSRPPMSRAS